MNQELRALVDKMKKELAQEVSKMNLANQMMEIDGIRHTLPLEGRTLDMVYYPINKEKGTDQEKKAPLLIGFYGGGFLFGGCAMNDYMWQALGSQLGVNVASIGYRKSPDHMWRDVLDDGYDASVYLKEHAEKFGFDPEHISVFGCSAGASLATRTALYAKKKGNLFFENEILLYPFVDVATDPLEKGEGSLSGPIMYVFNEFHRTEGEARLPLVSPVFATTEELRGMPNTVIVLSENDCLRAEGQKYGELLAAAGVPVYMTCMEGMPHGFFEAGFGVRGEEVEFLGEAVLSGIKDGTIPQKSAESMEFIKRHLVESESFYSEENLAYIEKSLKELHAGKGQVHELIEADDG
ncbi:MAG: alpha/beta hydrolase [Clostridiales bacterium]|nr:alpha/beta hydrolase [Clostridiales bacterium]